MKKIIVLLIIITQSILAQQVTLTLEESIKIGMQNSKELKIADSKIKKADEAISEISASMLPKLSLYARYIRFSDVYPFEFDLPMLPQPVIIQETILDNYNLSATVEQPIFTGFKLSSLKSAAEYNKNAEGINYEKEEIVKIDAIQNAFWKYYIAQQMKILVEENLNALKSHLKNTQSFLDNGLVTKNDFLKLKVEVANVELKLLETENNMQLARAMFNKTIGLPLNNQTKLNVENLSSDENKINYNELLNFAQSNRQEIGSLKFKLKALEEKKDAAQSDYYPQIFAFGNIYYNKPNQRYLPLENKFNDSWDIGVGLKWDIWNWGGTSSKVEQSEQDLIQAGESLKLIKENVEFDVYNNYLSLQKALKKIEISELQLESAHENYRITKKKYNQQLATSTDLIDAEASLLNAKTTYLTSKVEYKIQLSSLNKSIGKISNYYEQHRSK